MDTQAELDLIIQNVRGSKSIAAGLEVLVTSLGSLIKRAEGEVASNIGEKITQCKDAITKAVMENVRTPAEVQAAATPSTWDTTGVYSLNQRVFHNGAEYISTVTANTGNIPSQPKSAFWTPAVV